jgi:hypothetical protein
MPSFIGPTFLENDFATPAREITTRHGVDRRLLLLLAALRDTRRQVFKPVLEVVSYTGSLFAL